MDLSQIAKQIKDASEMHSIQRGRHVFPLNIKKLPGIQMVVKQAFTITLLVKICLFGTMNIQNWTLFPAV